MMEALTKCLDPTLVQPQEKNDSDPEEALDASSAWTPSNEQFKQNKQHQKSRQMKPQQPIASQQFIGPTSENSNTQQQTFRAL